MDCSLTLLLSASPPSHPRTHLTTLPSGSSAPISLHPSASLSRPLPVSLYLCFSLSLSPSACFCLRLSGSLPRFFLPLSVSVSLSPSACFSIHLPGSPPFLSQSHFHTLPLCVSFLLTSLCFLASFPLLSLLLILCLPFFSLFSHSLALSLSLSVLFSAFSLPLCQTSLSSTLFTIY